MLDFSKAELKEIVRKVIADLDQTFPIGISNRHIHLTPAHFEQLFSGQSIEKLRDLKQPGEFAAKQTVTLIGPKGKIERVRILGPFRNRSQVEVSKTDARLLGINPPIKLSGDLDEAVEITLMTEAASITIPATIIAQRHIHLNHEDMKRLDLHKDESVSVEILSGERGTVYHEVALRPHEKFIMEMHIDTDEANAANVTTETRARIIR
uniref:phosphate propanoyltransferase n=1 Tax=Enterococcus mundtii TaxID=53346 RepID=UPI0021B157F0|nr:phosphate propanoyltransferase [Enterococcus mundtii]